MKKRMLVFLTVFFSINSIFANQSDFSKVDSVMEKMSARAKKEIVIENKQEFIEDLHKVLAEEKNTTLMIWGFIIL